MASEVITLLGSPVVEKTIDVAYRFCKNNFDAAYGVEKDIEKLKSKLSCIAEVLEKTDNNNVKDMSTIDWLKKLRDVALDADDMLDTYATEGDLREMRYLPTPVGKIQSRLKAQHKIRNLLNKLDDIYQDKKQFEVPEKVGLLEGSEGSSNSYGMRNNNIGGVIDGEIVGRGEEKDKIVKWLMSRESVVEDNNQRRRIIPLFAVTGMGGLGKTTVAQQVYNEARVKNKFKKTAWIHVSKFFDVGRIVRVIHEKMRADEDDELPQNRLAPFLLVLDDVWVNHTLVWENLHHEIFHLLPKGSKVLVTSRDQRVVNRLGASDSHALGILPDEACRILFFRIVSPINGGDLDEEKNEIGKKIVEKCLGLPLSVKVIAALLCGKNLEFWKRTEKNTIWAAAHQKKDEGLSQILPALRLSFDDLPPILKVCFTFTCMYPKRQQIHKHDLVKLWMAEGYVYHPGGGVADSLEQLGGDYFDELHSRALFQLSIRDNKKIYSMHDLCNDLATHVSIDMQKVEDTSQSINAQCRHVSLVCQDIEKSVNQQLLKARKLRTLLQPGKGMIDSGLTLKKLFKSLRYMRVLDLSSSSITDLPKSIKYLKLLCYLDLSHNDIRSLPRGICKLLKMQTLKLLGCLDFHQLPEELGKLEHLRHLELDEIFWFKCSNLPPGLGRLTYLHTLHCFHVHRMNGYGIKELKSMNCLQGLLRLSKLENASNSAEAMLKEKTGITNLILEWSEGDASSPQDQSKQQEEVLDGLEPYKDLEELTIQNYKGTRLSNWMRVEAIQRFTKLHRISLKHCVNCRILTLGPLPHLQYLIIKGMLELEEWPENTSFPSLSRLTVSHCPRLRNLPRSSFLSLSVLKIKQCYALRALPVMPFLMFLKLFNNDLLEDMNEVLLEVNVDANLEHNHIISTMPGNQMNLIQIIINSMRPANNNNNNIEMVQFKIDAKKFLGCKNGGPHLVHSFFQLLELEMVNCPSVQALPKSFAPQKLKISGCPSLTTLPDQHMSQRFHYLEVDKCSSPSLIETIQSSKALEALTISNINNMTSLPSMLLNYPKLGSLYIHKCQDLESLSKEGGLLAKCKSLKFLSVTECHNLVTFAEEGLPVSLEWLMIKKCSKLVSIHGRSNDYLSKLISLKDLYLEDCPNIASLPEDTLPVSLQHLCIKGCPLLTRHCNKDTPGKYWDLISNILDLDIDILVNTHNDRQPQPSCCWFSSNNTCN